MSVTLLYRPKDLLSPKGRIGRVTYLLDLVLFNLLFFAVDIGAAYSYQALDPDFIDRFGWLYAVVAVIAVMLIYVLFCIHAKRLHDLGLSGFICLILFVPPLLKTALNVDLLYTTVPAEILRALNIVADITAFLSILLQIALLVVPGRHDENRYGISPKAA